MGSPNFEVILVDDASDFSTERLIKKIKGVRVLTHSRNLGFVRSANAGASLARGNYLLFLNSDAFVESESLENALRVFLDTPWVGAVGGKILVPKVIFRKQVP